MDFLDSILNGKEPVLDPLPEIDRMLTDIYAFFANFFATLTAAFEDLFSFFS